MHAHTIHYTNFNDEKKSKVVNFNLTEAELTKLQKDYLAAGGIQKVMNDAIESGDTKRLLDFFELLVHRSYGIKSADGEEFFKSPELMASFENQAFYSDLYMSFFQDEGQVGQNFIRAVMPAALIARAEANVRGEGTLADQINAQQAVKPDARQLFEQSRANLQDHRPAQQSPTQFQPTVPQQTQPSPQQPYDFQSPIVPTTPPVQNLQHEAPTYQQPQENFVSRPPHESGPGYEAPGANGL